MLTLLESREEKVAAHDQFEKVLRNNWAQQEERFVVWRPSGEYLNICHNGKYWFSSVAPKSKDVTPRYWHPFGEYKERGNLRIAVELNVPTRFNTARVSGFFAKDIKTGVVYLLHDGGVGGGGKGVGKAAFIRWSDAKPVSVVDSRGEGRFGIIVAPIAGRATSRDVSRFVQTVIEFKQAVKEGIVETATRVNSGGYYEYYDEFSGKKRRRRIAEVGYISRHGDIVRALRKWRRRSAEPGDEIVKNAYIDMGIRRNAALVELYEVKTSSDRQTLYSAIGQIVVHDTVSDGKCKRVIVLPHGEGIPDDVRRALRQENIFLLRFKMDADKVTIVN